jgi:hypothetical protein
MKEQMIRLKEMMINDDLRAGKGVSNNILLDRNL